MLIAIKFTFLMTLITGIIYPLMMTGVAQFVFPQSANGSLIIHDEKIIGSELIAQKFTSEKYFWSRLSAIDYNPMSSGASNLGPTSEALYSAVKDRSQSNLDKNSQQASHKNIQVDMLFASGSGLDPHISPEAAESQVLRVAKAREMSEESLNQLVKDFTEARQFGILGENRVNVLKLNLALDRVR